EKAGQSWSDEETDGMGLYTCTACGGEIIADETTGATRCPYCDNPIVLKGKFQGDLKPDLVIPFRLDKEAAKEALKAHMSGKKLLPKLFTDENHLDEVKGVYVPFWLFDAEAEGDFSFQGTRVRTWSDRDYNYTETQYFHVERGGTLDFDHVPVDGATKMPDDLMDSIEPYDFSQAVDFKTAYLSGYLADKYDVSADQSIERANTRIRATTSEAIRQTVKGYMTVTEQGSQVRLRRSKAIYALLPVWILNTTWQGQKYVFAMNGQTGKFVGNMPMDKAKYWKLRLLYGGIVAAVIFSASVILRLLF
ncbi:MAG: hypothetical protein IKX85_06685, partial [Clostridia bacterium]|nr:hypothetical protein [Clostridia bacterium]